MNARDEAAIQPVIEILVKNFDPEKIYLFGSRARGDARDGSDYDILMIAPSTEERWRRVYPIYDALRHLRMRLDVHWWTSEEVSDWSGLRNFYLRHALDEGIVVYEADASRSCEDALAQGRE